MRLSVFDDRGSYVVGFDRYQTRWAQSALQPRQHRPWLGASAREAAVHRGRLFQKLVHRIERDIQKKRRGEVTTKEVGEIVMRALEKFDKIAYIRFASVYRAFKDVASFEQELKQLLGGKAGKGKKKTRPRRPRL